MKINGQQKQIVEPPHQPDVSRGQGQEMLQI